MGKKRPSYEYVVVTIVVALTVFLGVGLYSGRAKITKGNLLLRELSMLRSSITLYKTINHRNPPSLKELASETYEVDSTPRPYVDRIPKDDRGSVVDPFGTPYLYDENMGWVRSATEGYERW